MISWRTAYLAASKKEKKEIGKYTYIYTHTCNVCIKYYRYTSYKVICFPTKLHFTYVFVVLELGPQILLQVSLFCLLIKLPGILLFYGNFHSDIKRSFLDSKWRRKIFSYEMLRQKRNCIKTFVQVLLSWSCCPGKELILFLDTYSWDIWQNLNCPSIFILNHILKVSTSIATNHKLKKKKALLHFVYRETANETFLLFLKAVRRLA